jgi:hypothetical protein
MKIYAKEYGWVRVYHFKIWIKWLLFCTDGNHTWKDLGDPCYCGSDNCYKCYWCGFETHD